MRVSPGRASGLRYGVRFVAAAIPLMAIIIGAGVGRSPALAGQVTSGGIVLDGYGGLHPFGGAVVNTAGAPYWPSWNIARSISVVPNGSGGWTLDGYGGIHPWGAPPQLNATNSPYWNGWDIARALVVLPGATGGYVLDGYGGVHNFGAAPVLYGAPYWGYDIATGLDIHYNVKGVPDGGWTLDAYGGMHPFGAAGNLPGSHYFTGYAFWRQLHVTNNGVTGAYLVGKLGIVDRLGNPPGINWSGMPNWGSWDIVRDVVPLNPTSSWRDPPFNRATAGSAMDDLMNFDRIQHGIPPLAENSTLDGIEGNGLGYNLASSPCNSSGTIGDRTQDMLGRNYFSHSIPPCGVTVFASYFPTWHVTYKTAGENIAWESGISSLADADWYLNTQYLNSAEHAANILGQAYTQVGCGSAYSASASYIGHTGPVLITGCAFTG